MEEVRQEVRALTKEVRGIRDDIAELRRLLLGGAYGPAKTTGNGHHVSTTACSGSPYQTHHRMADGSCSCQHAPAWSKAKA
jgi:hypothetical protein